MTTKELRKFYLQVKHCKRGYCCEQTAPEGKCNLIILGTNHGLYGWNWTAYYSKKTDTLYVSNYRNVPAYIAEK